MNQNTGAIVGIVVIALILLAGGPAFCGGNENKKIKREKAKNMVMYVIIGLMVIWAAPFVVKLILGN